MMLENKYSRWYYNIIQNAKCQVRNKKESYFESHHILPKCIGGKNDLNNLVLLTCREHIICHWLLTKMFSDSTKYRMRRAFAAMMMNSKFHQRFISLRTTAIAREQKFGPMRVETKRKLSERVVTDNTRAKMSAAKKGITVGNKNNMFGRNHTEEVKEAHAKRMKDRLVGDKNGMYGKKRLEVSSRNKLPKRWVTNGITDKLVLLEEAPDYFTKGYRVGRTKVTKNYPYALS